MLALEAKQLRTKSASPKLVGVVDTTAPDANNRAMMQQPLQDGSGEHVIPSKDAGPFSEALGRGPGHDSFLDPREIGEKTG